MRSPSASSASSAGPSAASRRHLPSISLASQTLPFGPLRYPRANPRAIGTQYPDFFAGSLARAERVSSLALRTVRAIAEIRLPKNFPKTCRRTEPDAQGRKSTKYLTNMEFVLSTVVRRGLFYPPFTAVTGVESPWGRQ